MLEYVAPALGATASEDGLCRYQPVQGPIQRRQLHLQQRAQKVGLELAPDARRCLDHALD